MNTLYTTLLIVYVLSVLGILVYTVLGLRQQRYITAREIEALQACIFVFVPLLNTVCLFATVYEDIRHITLWTKK